MTNTRTIARASVAVFLSLYLHAQETQRPEDVSISIQVRGRTLSGDDTPRSPAEMYSAELRDLPSTSAIFSSGPNRDGPEAGKPISARRLAHRPPKIARKEFERALSQLRKRRPDEAEQHLRKAVNLDPEYLEAHAQLGSLYLRKGMVGIAMQHLDAAIAIEPNAGELHSNKAWALLTLGRFVEAEASARLALRLDSMSERNHYLLSVALVQQGRGSAELLEHLRIAARKYPEAGKALSELEAMLRTNN